MSPAFLLAWCTYSRGSALQDSDNRVTPRPTFRNTAVTNASSCLPRGRRWPSKAPIRQGAQSTPAHTCRGCHNPLRECSCHHRGSRPADTSAREVRLLACRVWRDQRLQSLREGDAAQFGIDKSAPTSGRSGNWGRERRKGWCKSWSWA